MTPTCLRALYDIGDYTPNGSVPNKIGFTSFGTQYARYSDFEAFKNLYAPELGNYNFT